MAKWFVTIEGREYGPLSATELKRAVVKGRVTAETPVRKEGMKSRVPAARVKGLFAAAKDKTAEIAPPLKKDGEETTSDDGEELKLAETNWSPLAATPSDEFQQPPAAQAKKKKKPATFSIRALPRGLISILILLVLATLFYLEDGLRGVALPMLIVYLLGPIFIVTLVNDFKIKNADHALYIECGGLVGFVLIATLFCWLIPGDNDLTSTTLFFWTPQLAYYYILRASRRSSSKPSVAKTRGWVDPIKQPPAFKAKQKKQPAMQLHRGWWVTAVAIVNFLVGSYIIVMTVELLTPYIWAPYAGRDAEWGIIVNSFGTVFELFVNLARMAVIVIFGVPACFSLLAGYGLIKRHEWARILSLVLAVLSGLFCGLLVATAIESTDPRSLGDLLSAERFTLLFGFYSVFNFVILLNPRFAAEFE